MLGILIVGLFLLLVARFSLRSPFFRIPLESAGRQEPSGETGNATVRSGY